MMINNYLNPDLNCRICSRLSNFRDFLKDSYPNWHNSPVSSFGSLNSRMLIVGLAPGMKGANATGRPFTGDSAGNTLYNTLKTMNLTNGQYSRDGKDNFNIKNIRIIKKVF